MTEYDKLVLLASSPMLIAIAIGIMWDLYDLIYKKINPHKNHDI
jgi:hypothetical protein